MPRPEPALTSSPIPPQQRPDRLAPPPLVLADGPLEAVKWLALFLMTLDHINKILFDEKLPAIFEIGRTVMPLFGFVLAYNLARADALKTGAYGRVMKRLALFGALASPMFVSIVGWWPLNIMFMLLLAVAIMYLIERGGERRQFAAMALFIVGGAFVEFWWFALLYCLAAWRYCQRPGWTILAAWIAAAASLYVVNRNLWALAAFPIVFCAPRLQIQIPRRKYVFYTYYPVHLAALWVAARLI
jgi:hypothetical protein